MFDRLNFALGQFNRYRKYSKGHWEFWMIQTQKRKAGFWIKTDVNNALRRKGGLKPINPFIVPGELLAWEDYPCEP